MSPIEVVAALDVEVECIENVEELVVDDANDVVVDDLALAIDEGEVTMVPLLVAMMLVLLEEVDLEEALLNKEPVEDCVEAVAIAVLVEVDGTLVELDV